MARPTLTVAQTISVICATKWSSLRALYRSAEQQRVRRKFADALLGTTLIVASEFPQHNSLSPVHRIHKVRHCLKVLLPRRRGNHLQCVRRAMAAHAPARAQESRTDCLPPREGRSSKLAPPLSGAAGRSAESNDSFVGSSPAQTAVSRMAGARRLRALNAMACNECNERADSPCLCVGNVARACFYPITGAATSSQPCSTSSPWRGSPVSTRGRGPPEP